ncbi:rRNA adenine N(6)-methyltransferase [Melia azedarach]|uniref:rRNA adenine N(6)-methyltransferase n=1 Tax=Melia azedarach TaxID=155640 RepID=A0ACC1YU79_MELAZ|nr:rRNA adenine N(6)-methyltransferase [Melia azedarach]
MTASLLFPNPLLKNPESRPKSPLPAYGSITSAKKRSACIVCARSQDDYHATLKALNSKGRFPRKSLGQHYMLNSEINEQLAGAADYLPVEKDPHMVGLVKERFASTDRLKVLQEDFVKCHIRSYMLSFFESRKSTDTSSGCAKVVANIPFNISTDVVKQLLPMGDIFSEVVLLLQEETAVRLVEPSLRTSEYRPINIFVNFYSEPEYKFKVPRTNFFPQPNVDAAVVTFKLKQPTEYPAVTSTKSFFSMVNSAFNGKRKMLRKTLQHLCTSLEIEKALRDIGLPATSRPEELTLDDFVKLHNLIVEV